LYVSRLEEVLAYLDYPDPAQSMQIEGRILRIGATTVRLGPQEAMMLRVLHEASGAAVTYSRLRAVGINNPPQMKHHLAKRLAQERIDLRIISHSHGYALRQGRAAANG
jgi:hypothetical protein